MRFFQLRATRDEASLVIGLAQSLNWLMASPIQWLEGGWIARVKLLMVTLLLCLVFFYAGQHLPLSQFWKVFSMNLPTAVVGAFYLIGYSLVALSVGFDDIRSWPCTTVEVDSAPQGWPVTMINLAEGTDPNDVRHSIHNRQGARRKLANMLREGSFT